jgi:hypothetical protein
VSARRALALALVGSTAALVAGCGGSSHRTATTATTTPARSEGRPITQRQALEVAQVLQRDYRHGASRVQGTLTIKGTPIDFRGLVDFRDGSGRLVVHQRGLPDESSRRLFWSRTVVLAQARPGAARYLRQAPDPEHDPLHNLIRFLNLLSARAIDNIQVLMDQDVRYLGRQPAGRHTYDRFRYGRAGHTVYWIDASTGLLARVDATNVDGSVIAISLLTHAPARVRLPSGAQVGAR